LLVAGLFTLSSTQAQEPIRIGDISPFTGPLAQPASEFAAGHELAADVINARGGVLGRKVVVIRGDAGNPQQGISAVEKLVNQDKVDLFMGTYGSALANAASDAALRYNKFYWETASLAQELTERGLPNFARGGPNAAIYAESSVKSALEVIAPKLGKKADQLKVWIEHEESVYGTSIAQMQKKLFETAGVKVVGVGAHNFRAIDLNDAILRARGATPDIWVLTGYVPDSTLLLRTMRDQGYVPPAILMLGTGDGREFQQALGGFMDGIFVVNYPHEDVVPRFAPGAAAFMEAYRKKYGREPSSPYLVLVGYTSTMILFDVIASAGGTDVDKMRAAVAAIDKPPYTYANGYGAKFDAKMQNTRAFTNLTQWQKGRSVTVYPNEMAAPGVVLVNIPRK